MQQVWRKRWKNTGWIALGAITLVLLVAAINKKNGKVCKGIEVSFNEEGNNFFVDEKGVITVLKEFGSIRDKEIKNIDLKALESRLRNDRWIANAELFFDNKQVLQVIIEEKEPVARIFTAEGTSYYIDSACRRLPLSEKLSARIPMFTSFPSARARLSKPDSLLLASVKDLAMFIQADEFWKAQVAQVEITPEGFEMIPTVGNHIVKLGKEGQWQQKFDRLFSFYKQVWTKVGFEKYDNIDVQFDGQVVTTIKGAKPTIIDSARARMAYQNLLTEVKKSIEDSIPVRRTRIVVKDKAKVQVPGMLKVDGVATTKINSLTSNENELKTSAKKEQRELKVVKAVAMQPATKTETEKQQVKLPTEKQGTQNSQLGEKKVPKAIMKKTR